MAKDGNYKPKSPSAPIDQDEQFFNTPEGQDITRMFEEFTSGKKTFDQVADEYDKKWKGAEALDTPKQAPAAPYVPVK